MNEVPRPTLALTQEALASAAGANVAKIGYFAYYYRETLAVAGRLETPPAAIVIGGVKKGFDRAIAYDRNQPYYVALGEKGANPLDKPLPRFEPTDDQLANLVACPIPRRWTTADLSEGMMSNMHKYPSVFRTAMLWEARFVIGSTAAGLVATQPLQSAGYETTYEEMGVGGVALGTFLGWLATVIDHASEVKEFNRALQTARGLRPFPVWETTGDGQIRAR